MLKTISPLSMCLGLVGAGLAMPQAGYAAGSAQLEPVHHGADASALQGLPLQFVPNDGQFDDAVQFKVRGSGHEIFFTAEQIAFVRALGNPSLEDPAARLEAEAILLEFEGANPSPEVEGIKPMPGRMSFYHGSRAQWREQLPTYGGVAYRQLYPGIDLVYSGDDGELKRDFIVAPGADPGRVRMRYEGTGRLSVRQDGALVLLATGGELIEAAPLVYQDIDGKRVMVKAGYQLLEDGTVGFALSRYDARYTLVIDPAIAYSSFFGGSGTDAIRDVDVMAGKTSMAAVGYTTSTPATFPLVSPIDGTLTSGTEAFVTFYDPAQPENMFTTYLGDGAMSYGGAAAHSVEVTDDGVIHVAGEAGNGFPTTTGPTWSGSRDIFVADISGATLQASRYVGTYYFESAYAMAVDPVDGSIYVGGRAEGAGLAPGSPFDSTFNGSADGFVVKLSSSLAYQWGTYLGGGSMDEVTGLALDDQGLVVVGYAQFNSAAPFPSTPGTQPHGGSDDAFLVQLSFSGTLSTSQFLGGSGADEAYDVAMDDADHVYVVGTTSSSDFPLLNALDSTLSGTDAFVARYHRDLPLTKQFATFLGGGSWEAGHGITWSPKLDVLGILGWTSSTDFPVEDPTQVNLGGSGYGDAFVAVMPIDGSKLYFATYLGGSSQELGATGLGPNSCLGGIDWDDEGALYVGGDTYSTNFPVTSNALDQTHNGGVDAFITVYNEFKF